jgi:hypothetical protein
LPSILRLPEPSCKILRGGSAFSDGQFLQLTGNRSPRSHPLISIAFQWSHRQCGEPRIDFAR